MDTEQQYTVIRNDSRLQLYISIKILVSMHVIMFLESFRKR
jgi:hypothetical protein